MKRSQFDALMAASPPATQAAGKRALTAPTSPGKNWHWNHARDEWVEGPASFPDKKPAIRIPKPRVPNKTEARFMEWAADRWRGCFIHYAPVTFHLPSGCKYTPDVMMRERPKLILGADDPYKLEFLTFIEVKGPHIHNQRSIHAFKEARAAFPMFRWIFAQYRDGEWALSELPP